MIPRTATSRLIRYIYVAVAVGTVGVAGCNGKPPAGGDTGSTSVNGASLQVNFGTGSTAVDYAPFYVAKNKGWIEDALKPFNATPQYTTFQGPAPIIEAYGSGKTDIVFVAEPPVINGDAAGLDIKIADVSCILSQQVLVQKNAGITSPAQLRGKKIAVLTGSSSHYGLLKILSKSGLTSDDVSIINMVPPDAKAAFDTKQISGWAVWPPFEQQEEIAGNGVALGSGTAAIDSLMSVRGEFLSQHRDIVKAIRDAIEKSKAWIVQHPAEAQSIVAKEIDVPQNVVERAWPLHNFKAQLNDDVVADIQAKADFLKSSKFIKTPVSIKAEVVTPPL